MRTSAQFSSEYGGRARATGLAALLLVLTCACARPAAADVLELATDGQVNVRASDRPMASGQSVETEPVDDLALPAEAITVTNQNAAPPAYSALLDRVAEDQQISPALLEALVWQESRWRAGARSSAGAIGLAQLMPGTARELGVNPLDPSTNLIGGARYLRQQLDRFDGDVERALAAYNAGPGRVLRAAGIPQIAETQAYVRAILNRMASISAAQGALR